MSRFGIGTQRIEDEAAEVFPGARIARLDTDAAARKGAGARLLAGFGRGEWDILIGTQMVTKGLDFPQVTLVGALSADSQLFMPDFRSFERTYAAMIQVAGRGGRGESEGLTVIQTYNPDNICLVHVLDGAYETFYETEAEHRETYGLPPFKRMAALYIACRDRQRAVDASFELVSSLRRGRKGFRDTDLFGPVPAPLARIKNRFRRQVILRAPNATTLQRILRKGLQLFHGAVGSPHGLDLTVDVDPIDLM
jgi:primosomal protein N' (replication factor Y)